MAKKLNDIILDANETVYSSDAQALVVLAQSNTVATLTPVLAPNGKVDGTTSKYSVQRRKRPAVNAVANANAGTTASALAALDQFVKAEYDAVEIATGVLRSVGFPTTFNDDYDFSLNPQHAKDAMYIVGEVAEQRKTDLLALMDTFAKTGAALPAYADGKTDVWNAISDEAIKVAQIKDEFKAVQSLSDIIVVISPKVAKELAQEMGKAFRSEAPIAQTGFTSGMSVNQSAVIVDPSLTGREVYVFHKEALAFMKQEISKDVSIDLGLVEYTGKFFYDVMSVIDKARAFKFGA